MCVCVCVCKFHRPIWGHMYVQLFTLLICSFVVFVSVSLYFISYSYRFRPDVRINLIRIHSRSPCPYQAKHVPDNMLSARRTPLFFFYCFFFFVFVFLFFLSCCKYTLLPPWEIAKMTLGLVGEKKRKN